MGADSHQWEPYSWEPVHYTGREFRVTYGFNGDVQELAAIFIVGKDKRRYPFAVSRGIAEVVIPAAEMDGIPDRAEAQIEIKTGGRWHVMCLGHLTRR